MLKRWTPTFGTLTNRPYLPKNSACGEIHNIAAASMTAELALPLPRSYCAGTKMAGNEMRIFGP